MAIRNVGAKSILVTGSSGFVGYPLARQLAADGHKVVGLDIKPAAQDPAPFTAITASVCDVHLIYRLFDAHRFDAVVHCGGISGPMVMPDDPYKECETNIFGTTHLLEAARLHRVSRFIFCSSQAAYGETGGGPIAEDTPFRPVTVYGATKAACDGLVRAYRIQHGLDAVSLRLGSVYGPGRQTQSLISGMVEAAVTGQPLCLPDSGGQRLRYVYVADIVSGVHAALDAPTLPLPAYNIGGPGSHSAEEIAKIIREVVPSAQISFAGAAIGPVSARGPLDCSAAERDFGYRPRFDMLRGIAAFADWMRSR
jgi:UDP-glucuronate 4-epimerase